jgi:spore germination cell wall hydrolase CwlJ-like protein
LSDWLRPTIALLLSFLPGASLYATAYEQKVIAAVIAGEASNQGRVGMVAVAEVICQRVLESGWTPYRVVIHGNRRGIHAFSCLNGTTPQALIKKWQRDPAYETALELAQLLSETPERLQNTTRSANFFAGLSAKPQWARGREPVVVIKDHAFYRIPAAAGTKRAW